jgi:hypothetical protein
VLVKKKQKTSSSAIKEGKDPDEEEEEEEEEEDAIAVNTASTSVSGKKRGRPKKIRTPPVPLKSVPVAAVSDDEHSDEDKEEDESPDEDQDGDETASDDYFPVLPTFYAANGGLMCHTVTPPDSPTEESEMAKKKMKFTHDHDREQWTTTTTTEYDDDNVDWLGEVDLLPTDQLDEEEDYYKRLLAAWCDHCGDFQYNCGHLESTRASHSVSL